MAQHLHCNHSIAFKGSRKELYLTTQIPFRNLRYTEQGARPKIVRGHVHCCTSSTPTKSDDRKVVLDPNGELSQLDCLVSDVNWQVRRMVETEDEIRQVASVQAKAFHEPVFLFDDLFFEFFKAEVLSGLLYRLKNSHPDRYACLVAEPKHDSRESINELVGVVDVTVQREYSVLQHLAGAEEYLYVSGIAVFNKFRRQKVATALLKACDILSATWGFEYLVLRAYEDDYGARKLYSNAGYRVVSGDAPWMTSWIGRRRRIVMVKQIENTATSIDQ